jgi:hypothetical protein
MTEQEWLALDNPTPMLELVANRASDRQLRLFLCACCARVLEGAPRGPSITADGRNHCLPILRGALRTVERFADGLCSTKELDSARRAADEAQGVPAYINYAGESGIEDEAVAVREAAARPLTPEGALGGYRQALTALRKQCRDGELPSPAPVGPLAEHLRDMAGWLRDVAGNPFRPAEVDPAWLARDDHSVVRVAECIYASGAFDEMRFLADALEDAGCADADILGHCRGPDPHVRGCWVLDLFVEAPRRFALVAASPEPPEESRPAAAEVPPSAQPHLRPGDWICQGCNAHNFARRDVCLRCRRSRPQPRLREGDWICPGCTAHNFARRQSCHQCKGARPS